MAQSVKPADVGVTVGEVFQGKYRVDSILGHGGMGVVAECTHLALNERVAIKMLRQDVLSDQDAVSRFIREAQAAVKLKSEYVARVSDVGTADNGTPYMVMEYLEGHDLGELLKQRGVLPVQWAVELMLQTAEGLCEAHSLGIVHRDVKPTNLFVTWRPDGSALIKVLDFGISKSPMGTDMHLTQTQSLLGTPAYMSPEQMRSARLVDHRTDIWSLGTVFYEILEGRKPFEAESFSEMCVKVAVDPPTQMQNTPPPIQQVIMRCLAKAHEQRYANMAEFARDLIPFAPDQHAAHSLVERMSRMLKRSTFDWEGSSTGVGRQALPQHVKDIASGPVRNTPIPGSWGVGSDPAGRSWHGPTPNPYAAENGAYRPTPNPYGGDSSGTYRPAGPLSTQDKSQPFARAYSDEPGDATTVSEQPRRRGRLWVLLLLLGLVTAGAVTFGVMKSKENAGTSAAETTEKALTPIADPAGGSASATAAQPPTAPDKVVSPATGSGQGSAAGSAAIATPETGAKTEPKDADKTTQQKATPTKDRQTQRKTEPGTKSNKTGGAGKSSTKEPKNVIKAGAGSGSADVKVEVKTEPAKPPCDPFGAMHGCQK